MKRKTKRSIIFFMLLLLITALSSCSKPSEKDATIENNWICNVVQCSATSTLGGFSTVYLKEQDLFQITIITPTDNVLGYAKYYYNEKILDFPQNIITVSCSSATLVDCNFTEEQLFYVANSIRLIEEYADSVDFKLQQKHTV